MIGLQAFLAGVVAGVLFGVLRMPVPAPPTVAGLLGIVGITVGWRLVVWLT